MNEYDDSEDRITVYCCAAVDPPAPRIADTQIVELESGDVASLMHCGPNEELAVAYHTLYAWVPERGHEEAGLVREVNHNDPAVVAASELLTELVLPIR
jgi:effector-binding domain-containing protein